MIKTCEFVSPRHPDKICDFIADSILDAFLAKDKNAHVAIEVMGGHKSISISGEVKSKAYVDIEKIVHKVMGKDYHVHKHVVLQSPFIAHGVDLGGAGDQGIMIGYATSETPNFMPYEYNLARELCQKIYKVYPFDGKVQVTVDGKKILTVVASFQNSKTKDLLEFVKKHIKAGEYLINPAGEWTLGGFDADSGLSGRKIAIDSYGPEVPIGGGSFSGKDATKVDRSGAYMARKIAVDLLKKHKAHEVKVKLAYAIGKPYPVMATVIRDSMTVGVPKSYDLSPAGIKKLLKLTRPIFAKTAIWGHFGRGFLWDL
ncbi:MAG: methionine adenosyltransferase domain-containing protein [Candidatus Doudnabacteria bacterium]|nr:methionine adenosyltransferase domain-containing protein [Candidatus Doudnabacteria bacterium]